MSTLVLVVLILLLFGVIGVGPWWPHSRGWGYTPVSAVGLLLVILLLIALFEGR
jgi:hypothetical protein